MAMIECACPNTHCSAEPHKGYAKCQQAFEASGLDVPASTPVTFDAGRGWRLQEDSAGQRIAICPPCLEANP